MVARRNVLMKGAAVVAAIVALADGGYRYLSGYYGRSAIMGLRAEAALIALAEQDWDLAALQPFADAALKAVLDQAPSPSPLEPLRPLGKVLRFLETHVMKQSHAEGRWTGWVQKRVQFEKGSGLVSFFLAWSDGDWQLDGLRVSPEGGQDVMIAARGGVSSLRLFIPAYFHRDAMLAQCSRARSVPSACANRITLLA